MGYFLLITGGADLTEHEKGMKRRILKDNQHTHTRTHMRVHEIM